MEAASGFEPPNRGFADRSPVFLLLMRYPGQHLRSFAVKQMIFDVILLSRKTLVERNYPLVAFQKHHKRNSKRLFVV